MNMKYKIIQMKLNTKMMMKFKIKLLMKIQV